MEKRAKIRVAHYCNQLGVGGTERTMEIFCRYLDKEKFEIIAIAKKFKPKYVEQFKVEVGNFLRLKKARAKKKLWSSLQARVPNFESILGKDNIYFAEDDADLRRIILNLKLDVLHVHYSGAPESPTSDEEIMKTIPCVVTTNPFERQNTAPAHRFVKKILFVSEWLWKNKATWALNDKRAAVLYNPIENPFSKDSLRAELKIPASAFVVGRVGRPDPGIHTPLSLEAYKKIETPDTYFLALSPPQNMIDDAKKLGIQNFIALPGTTDPIFLSKFYNTIDALAHARRDGETFGCNIAEAMIHGKPVVSHLTAFMNAQTEVIADTGFVVGESNVQAYAEKLLQLRDNKELREKLGQKAQARALEVFEAEKITQELAKTYLSLLN